MAPVEADADASSGLASYALFTGRAFLVVGLSINALFVARNAAMALPPSSRTRSQLPLRRTYAAMFLGLALLSLASVTVFAFVWRALSYMEWYNAGRVHWPNALWRGWYGNDAGRWHLRHWLADVNLAADTDLFSIQMREGFLWTSQHYIGLLASAIFMGAEGHRRNMEPATIATFVLLSATGSLGFALSLFFVVILYTPLTLHNDDVPLHDALFAPSPAVYYAPIASSLLFLYWLPDFLTMAEPPQYIRTLRYGYTLVPLFLAFAPKIVPLSLGRTHTSKAAAHRSYAKVFHFLALASFVLHWKAFTGYLSAVNTTDRYGTEGAYGTLAEIIKSLLSTIGLKHQDPTTTRLLSRLSTMAQNLALISTYPLVSVTCCDISFAFTSLLAWSFTRNLDVDAMLANSILSFLAPKHVKHVAFGDQPRPLADLQPDYDTSVDAIAPRKRGRPAKNKTAINGMVAASAASARRSLRQRTHGAEFESDEDPTSFGDSAYEPTTATKRDVAEIEADGVTAAPDLVHGGESTALALFLTFLGGMGQMASSTLGAEVTGPME